MNHPIAIVIAGALIAAAIALTNRWTLHSQVLVRMDNCADSDEVARAFRDYVARRSDMMSPGSGALAGG